jgi:2-polyprenyl-3-methyl-5-hydroxy-6-metoxy-1,4-benzoquinol methylase
MPFPSRIIEPELLEDANSEDARRNLADIIRLNKTFGGHGLLLKMLRGVARPGEAFTLLDVGAASGDSARVIQAAYPEATIISLDLQAQNLEAAPSPKLLADAFQLPFRDGAVDFVFNSLFLHHFADEQVTELLRDQYRVARRALLVSDLERHVLSYWFLPATKPLFRWHWITVHDGPVSVRAAFRPRELEAVARRAGIPQPQVATHRPAFRISLIAEK